MIKKVAFVFLLHSSLSACCLCTVVSGAMSTLSTTISKAVNVGDVSSATFYSLTVLKNDKKSLKLVQKRLLDLSHTLQIKGLSAKCNNAIDFQAKKTNVIIEEFKIKENTNISK